MTGFGRADGVASGLTLTVEATSVNRRYLETSLSVPRDWQEFERTINERVRKRFSRGKIHVNLQVDTSSGETGFYWEEDALRDSIERLKATSAREGIVFTLDAETLIRLATLHRKESILPPLAEVESDLSKTLDEAVEALFRMRAEEGAALRRDISSRTEALRARAQVIGEASQGTVERYRELLFARLRQAGLELELSDERVLKEIAIFADRADISEELTRLQSHLEQFAATIGASESESVGRKLEFLLQEILREFNTIGSKSNNSSVTMEVVEAKSEVEKIREQLQNVE